MTFGELANYAQSQFTLTQTEISDWRPAGDMYIDDLCMPFVAEGKDWVSIPNGIRFWLENGDSIIYVRKKDKKGDKQMQDTEIMKEMYPLPNVDDAIKVYAIETMDDFIFRTISPYCNKVIERKISKDLLKRALIEYFKNHTNE